MKKRISIAFLILAVSVLSCACQAPWQNKSNKPDIDGYIYYTNQDRDDLTAFGFDFGSATGQVLADLMTEKLSLSADKESISPLPDGVVIDSTELHEGTLNVRFSKLFEQVDEIDRYICLAALVRTYTQIPQVTSVSFFIMDEPLINEEGEAYSGMTAFDFLCLSDDLPATESQTALTLYYGNENGENLSKAQIPYTPSIDKSVVRIILMRLIEGPVYEEETRTIPEDTKILGVSVMGNTAYINLSKEFSNLSDDLLPDLSVYAIVNSITGNTDITRVQLLVEGKALDSYGGQIDLRFPLEEDLSIVK